MFLNQVIFLAFLVTALTAAFSRGGRPERLGGAMLLAAALLTPIAQTHLFVQLEVGIAVVDTMLFCALIWLAFTSERRWATFAAAFQGVAVLTHVARFKTGPVHGDVYAALLVFWSYPVVLSLLWGALIEARQTAASPAGASAAPPIESFARQAAGALPRRRAAPIADDLGMMTRLLRLHGLGDDSAALATRLIDRAGSFAAVAALPPGRLRQLGFDERVVEALSFARDTTQLSLRRKLETRPSLANGEDAIDYLHSELAHLPHEQFRVLYLNARYRLIHDEVHAEGSVTEAPVFPREIVKRAIESGAVYLILAHNHPGGDPTPSRADIVTTHAIIAAAKSIGVTVVDHIVVSPAGHVSMRATGSI